MQKDHKPASSPAQPATKQALLQTIKDFSEGMTAQERAGLFRDIVKEGLELEVVATVTKDMRENKTPGRG